MELESGVKGMASNSESDNVGVALLPSSCPARRRGHPQGGAGRGHTVGRAGDGPGGQGCRDAVAPIQAPARRAGAATHRTVLDVDRGLSWAEAVAMRDAHVAEVAASGGAVDRHVGFHIFTAQKEVGKTGAAAAPRPSHTAEQSDWQIPAVSVHPLASALPAIARLQRCTEGKLLLPGRLPSAVP